MGYTKAINGLTIDTFCISHVERLIDALKDETYQPKPSQRDVYKRQAQRGWIQADPAQLYAAGVKASFEQWGAEGVDEYLAQEAVAYTGTDARCV